MLNDKNFFIDTNFITTYSCITSKKITKMTFTSEDIAIHYLNIKNTLIKNLPDKFELINFSIDTSKHSSSAIRAEIKVKNFNHSFDFVLEEEKHCHAFFIRQYGVIYDSLVLQQEVSNQELPKLFSQGINVLLNKFATKIAELHHILND
ncbi:MAG: hypothetical protein EBS86_12550 [Crocinitomicaceae bacterium]|nr:hypothetical protein [Crocinitomicaceae bacterium]